MSTLGLTCALTTSSLAQHAHALAQEYDLPRSGRVKRTFHVNETRMLCEAALVHNNNFLLVSHVVAGVAYRLIDLMTGIAICRPLAVFYLHGSETGVLGGDCTIPQQLLAIHGKYHKLAVDFQHTTANLFVNCG